MITDSIMLAALLYFFYRGWRKGALRTLLGPITLIAGFCAAFIYYQQTRNIPISLLICFLGPIALKIFISLMLKIWDKATDKKVPLSIFSRLFGSLFSILWSGSYIVLFIISIGLLPMRFGWLEKIQDDVAASKSYTIIDQFMKSWIPATSGDIKKLTAIFQNPDKLQQFQSTKEFKALMTDDNLKEIFSDKEIVEQLQNKDYGKLLTNPKIQSIFQNEQVLKKMFALNKKIMTERLDDKVLDAATENQPNVVNIK